MGNTMISGGTRGLHWQEVSGASWDGFSAWREGPSESVAAAGGLWVVARRSPAASDLVGIYEDVGAVLITLGTSSVPSFRFSTSVSDGPATGAIRSPPAI